MLNTTYNLDCFGISDIGLIREHNEDVWEAFPDRGFFLIADGMGGHSAGEIAAKKAIDYLAKLIKEWNPAKQIKLEQVESFFREALIETNRWIYQQAQSDDSLNGMGTTIGVLFFLGSTAILSHVGDSRIYRLRNTRLKQLTEDHSLVSEMIALGAMSPEDGKTFPYKHILTRAMGTHPLVEPTVTHCDVKPFDLFMLCSDGLTNFVKDDEIKEVLSENIPIEKKGQELIDLANEHGGGDNVTLVLVKIGNDLLR